MKIDIYKIRELAFSSYFLFTIGSIIIFIISLIIIIQDDLPDWANYQKEYKNIALGKATTDQDKEEIAELSIEIKQIVIDPLDKIDRCITCHIGINDPIFKESHQPLTTHPGNYLQNHPSKKFGCTICHEGSGMATISEEAHGDNEPSLYPMFRGVFIQASCGKCHSENQFNETSALGTGKRLFDLYGCRVCHKVYKSGGTAGPDLTVVGGKKYQDFYWGEDYDGKHSISEWFINHFKDPSYYYPSKMMNFKMTDENAIALSVYMLSLTPEVIPVEYLHGKNEEK